MIKKNLFLLFVLYLFVVEMLIVGYLRGDVHFYYLAGINFIAILLIVVLYFLFSDSKKSSTDRKSVAQLQYRKKIVASNLTDTPELVVQEKTVSSEVSFDSKLAENVSTINNEKIQELKAKIRKTDPHPLKKNRGIYRMVFFILCLLGVGGVVFFFWSSFGMLSLSLGAFFALLLIRLLYKGMHLWRKTLRICPAFLFFFALLVGGVSMSMLSPFNPMRAQVEEAIDTWLVTIENQLEKNQDQDLQNNGSDTHLEEKMEIATGTVLDMEYSGDSILEPIDIESSSGLVSFPAEELVSTGVSEKSELPLEVSEKSKEFLPLQQITYFEAIKYLIDTNKVPLSTLKNLTFTYVGKENEKYPYMKTAAELKMIGTNINPNDKVGCEVYIVFKGLVEKRVVSKTADVKGDYWKVAEAKGLLNGCKKGSFVRTENL